MINEKLFQRYSELLDLYIDLVGYATFSTLGLELDDEAMSRAIEQMQGYITGARNEPVTDESLDLQAEGDYS